MNDTIYEKLFCAFKEYLNLKNINAILVHVMPTKEAKYPLIVLEEIRNVPIYVAKVGRTTSSEVGVKFSIFAVSQDGKTHQSIANDLAKIINHFMFDINGIPRDSKTMIPNADANNTLYRIDVVYTIRTYDNGEFVY